MGTHLVVVGGLSTPKSLRGRGEAKRSPKTPFGSNLFLDSFPVWGWVGRRAPIRLPSCFLSGVRTRRSFSKKKERFLAARMSSQPILVLRKNITSLEPAGFDAICLGSSLV